MNSDKNKEVFSVIKFVLFSMAIMIFGFIVMNKNHMPASDKDVMTTSYETLIEQMTDKINSDMLMVNDILLNSLNFSDLNENDLHLLKLAQINQNFENIHIYYDGEEIDHQGNNGLEHYDTLQLYQNSTSLWFVSDPYLDPISGEDIITVSYHIKQEKDIVIAYDLNIRKIIQNTEDLTHKNIVLNFNDQQRIYSANGFVVDEDIFSNSSISYNTFLDQRYQLIYLGVDEELSPIELVRGFPAIIIVILIVLIFVSYIISHYNAMILEFYRNIENPIKPSKFNDLIGFKTTFQEIKKWQKKLETERSVFNKIKITEHEKVADGRQKNKRLEEEIAKLKALTNQYSDQLSVIANVTPALVWITDANDKITFFNSQINQRFQELDMKPKLLTEMLEDFDTSSRLLKKRDYNKIKLKIKGVNNSEALSGKTKRIFFNNSLRAIFYMTSTSNFDAKMQNNYLKKSRDLHFINEVTKIINNNNDIEQTLQEVIEKVSFLGNFNSCTIRLARDNQYLEMVASAGYSLEHLYQDRLEINERHIGLAFEEDRTVVINTINDMQLEEPFIKNILTMGRSVAYLPLSNFNRSFGILGVVSDFPFNTDTLVMLESIAINITISLEKLVLYDQLKSNYFKTVEAFVNATEIKSDRYTGHSRRVAEVCSLIAERLYLSKTEADEIFISGLLHDVGKLAFQDDSTEYFSDVNKHGSLGKEMIENVGLSNEILEGIAYHHMNFSEKLYISKDDSWRIQPYYAQIIRLANDFDVFVYKDMEDCNYSSFFEKYKDRDGDEYAPQIFEALKDITLNQPENIANIYKDKPQ